MSWTNDSQKEHFVEAMKNSGILDKIPALLYYGDEKTEKVEGSYFRKSCTNKGISEFNWETVSDLRAELQEFWHDRNEQMLSFVNFTVANAFANKGKAEAGHEVSGFIYEF